MMKISTLELLHPDGIANTSVVLGGNCPEKLRPEVEKQFNGTVELFILAPTAKECGLPGWLESAVKSMSGQLTDDGIGYVLVSRQWRRKVIRLLRQAGLVMDTSFWHFPNWSRSRYLVPLEREPSQFAVDEIFSASSGKRVFARQMFHYSATRQLLTTLWDRIGISVRRPGARPLFQWLFPGEQYRSSPGTAFIRTSWRESNGAIIAYGFSKRYSVPSVIAKVIPAQNTTTHPNQEAHVLGNLGLEARRAGARVPEIIFNQQDDQRSTLLQSFIPGRSISDVLYLNPALFSPIMMQIVDWLQRWNQATVIRRTLMGAQLEQTLLVPLDRLAPFLQQAETYRTWLATRLQAVAQNPVPLVATHNDLTMANLLLNDRDQLGVVDWETGCLEGLPLVDFYYAVTDAVRIVAKCANWLDAIKACFQPQGLYTTDVAAWEEQLQLSTGLSPDFKELCFHACWLHHADNEQKVSRPGESRPFLEIVQWLVSHESR